MGYEVAASAAHVWAHAPHAANYALKAASFASAAAPANSGGANAKERDWQYRRMGPRPSKALGRREMGLHVVPLGIGNIRRVMLSHIC